MNLKLGRKIFKLKKKGLIQWNYFKTRSWIFSNCYFILVVTIIVTTRSFMPAGVWKRALLIMTIIVGILLVCTIL